MTPHQPETKYQQSPKIDSIQHLRALAAGVVVLGHAMGFSVVLCGATTCHFLRPDWPTGAGVDLFFLISGFIMVLSSARLFGSPLGWRDFLLRRGVRIIPLYWGVTAFTLLALVIKGKLPLPSGQAVAASFLFFPFDTNGRSDGFAFPIVDLGWTLNYEFLFYLFFSAFMRFGRQKTVVFVSIALTILVLLGVSFASPPLAIRFWTQPIMITFAIGMWLALIFVHGKLHLSAIVRLILIAVAAIMFVFPPFTLEGATTPNNFARLASWGLPATLLLTSAISGASPFGRRVNTALVALGDSSYCLYLIHPIWFMVVGAIVTRISLFQSPYAIIIIALFGAVATSLIVHFLVERPLTSWLTKRLQLSGVPIGAVPLPESR